MSNTTIKLPTCPKCGAPIPLAAPQGLCPKCVLLGAATATEQGAPATATSEIPSIERIAAAFPQLEILDLIGRGGMGFVFKARQPHLDRFVALKLLPDKLAKDAQFAERFNREGRVLAKLNHPNIVSVFDFGQTGGFYYLLMEYIDGVNLRQAMRTGRFSPSEALSLVPKVCAALQYAHEQGILHRDIKPENILLDANGRVKIADFGIAKLVGEDQLNVTLTNTGAALGTPHYMAPEQLEKPSTVDHRADIYSLGVVFYEMLTGELPIGRFAPPSSKTPVNATVDEVVFRTLEKDRELRYQSAGEMKTQVEHLGDGSAVTAAAHGGGNQPMPQHRRGVLKWVFIGLFLAGIGVLVVPNTIRRPASLEPSQPVHVPSQGASGRVFETSPMIQFTFTTVDLREEEGARWLAMDFVEQTRGDCQRTFRYSANVPGFTMQTRTTSFMTDSKAGFPPVLHQRIMWKLPDSLSQPEAQALRDLVGKERIGKPIVLEPGEEYPLFKTVVASGGSLVAAVGVKLKSEDASGKAGRKVTPSSMNMASAELWAPKLAPGEKPNPSEILQEAKSLAQEGRYEEALQRQIWYHNHALEIDRAQAGVRLSFALSSWTELARRYPKAKDALVEVRYRGLREFEQGGGYFDLFMEVAAINREFNEQDVTIALLKSIDARDPKLAGQCYFAAEDLLLERANYSLCARFIRSFQQRFEQSRATRERMLSLVDRNPEANRSEHRKQADRAFIKASRALIEILVGVGRQAEAENIRDQAVTVLNVPELASAVDDAVTRVEKLKARLQPQ